MCRYGERLDVFDFCLIRSLPPHTTCLQSFPGLHFTWSGVFFWNVFPSLVGQFVGQKGCVTRTTPERAISCTSGNVRRDKLHSFCTSHGKACDVSKLTPLSYRYHLHPSRHRTHNGSAMAHAYVLGTAAHTSSYMGLPTLPHDSVY